MKVYALIGSSGTGKAIISSCGLPGEHRYYFDDGLQSRKQDHRRAFGGGSPRMQAVRRAIFMDSNMRKR